MIAGFALIAASFYIGFIALVFLGGGHHSPFSEAPWFHWVFRLAVLGIPLSVAALGITCLIYRNKRDWRRPAFVFLAVAIDLVVIFAAAAYSNSQRDRPHSGNPCEGLPASACRVAEPRAASAGDQSGLNSSSVTFPAKRPDSTASLAQASSSAR